VHYNGYCFGANFAKMLIIREREAKQESESAEYSDLSEDESSDKSQNDSSSEKEAAQNLADIVKVEEEVSVISGDQINDHFNRVQFEKFHFGESSPSESDNRELNDADAPMQDQGLEVKSGFSLQAQHYGPR